MKCSVDDDDECADTPTDDPKFQAWVTNFLNVGGLYGPHMSYAAPMQSNGCAHLQSLALDPQGGQQWVDEYCDGFGGNLKGAAVFCPVTCNSCKTNSTASGQ